MKTNWMVAWTMGAVLLVAAIAGITTASGQKTGNLSGAKQWLAAMDTDHDGSVSKQEFMAYMESQFDKADADHDGTLDGKELERLRKNLGIAATQ